MNFRKTLVRQCLIALAVAIGVCSPAQGAKVTLQWDPSPDSAVIGYKVHAHQQGAAAPTTMDVSNSTSATIDNLAEGATYSIFITAYDAARVESDPSNQVAYAVPGVPENGFALQFAGFSHGTVRYSPHGAMTPMGEVYAAGAEVTLTAMPQTGFVCTGWMINSVFVPENPTVVTMNQDTFVAPVLKKTDGRTLDEATQISLKIGVVSGRPTISVGGELGAWTLEGSNNLTTWSAVATGLTSQQLTVGAGGGYAFYRVRSNPLSSFQSQFATAETSATQRFNVQDR